MRKPHNRIAQLLVTNPWLAPVALVWFARAALTDLGVTINRRRHAR